MATTSAARVESSEEMSVPARGSMKAIVKGPYGEPKAVLSLRDVAMPAIKDGEVLVRVHSASVHVGDLLIVRGVP